MAYSADRTPQQLTTLATLASDDTFVVGDTSDPSEVAKAITKANLITDLGSSFAAALGADDNYVTDAEKAALHAAVTVTDGTTINLTLTGQDLTAEVIDDTITNAKLANVATSTIKGRVTAGTGDPEDLTATQVRTLLNVADGATANTGTVTSVAVSGSDGIEVDSGSPITGAGTIALGVNATNLRTHINVENGADVTDATNVAAAGAVMDGDFGSNGIMERTGAGTYGVVTKPSGALVGTTDTQTLTNKRVSERLATEASTATPTINTDTTDYYSLTALATNVTSFTTNLSGTPTKGQKLIIEVTPTATRTVTWGASFEDGNVHTLPTEFTGTATVMLGFVWNSITSKWRLVALDA